MIYNYPLAWPAGWPRNKRLSGGGFQVELEKAERDLERQLGLLGVKSAWLSTDFELRLDGRPRRDRPPASYGVALHFTRQGKELTIPCDRFNSLRDNVRAIGLTLEAIRSMERYGTSQMIDAALSGFAALPSGTPEQKPRRPWHEVLGVSPDAPREVVEAAGKAMQRKTHPDAGGTDAAFKEVQDAIEEAQR